MKKLLVYLDEDMHEDLKEMALRNKVSMSELIRYAVDKTFEDQLDVMAAERAMREFLADPTATISLDDYAKERGIELSSRTREESEAKARQIADNSGTYTT